MRQQTPVCQLLLHSRVHAHQNPPAVVPHDCLLPHNQHALTVAYSAQWVYQGCTECLDNLKERLCAGIPILCGML